jgi:hypothetical protein
MGWKLPAIADAVMEDKVRHADPIGTTELACPVCAAPRQMTCYRFASGPFGTHKGLHLICSTCGGRWTVDRSDSERVLATMRPVDASDT